MDEIGAGADGLSWRGKMPNDPSDDVPDEDDDEGA